MPAEVTIRPYEPGDALALHDAIHESMTELLPWMPWAHAGYSRDEAESWIALTLAGRAAGTMYDFAILVDGRFAGACGVNQINGLIRFANLGYWVRTGCAGQGVAPRAVRQLLGWTFRETGLNRIEIVAAVGNVKSQRVAEKVGARREAVLTERVLMHGQPVDAVMFSVLRRAWAAQ